MAFYRINQSLGGKARLTYEVAGFLLILAIWYVVTLGDRPLVEKGILPSPYKVLLALGELIRDNELIPNFCYSLGLNLGGYIEAIFISIPLGFALGLMPKLRAGFARPVDAARFLVLPAAVGLFIAWFGIGSWMKIHFLAFGIIIYLLPVAITRVMDVEEIYLKTAYTLGADRWQMIKTVYFPSVISRLFSDIRILTAISWTYIVIAEAIGGEAGIGALTWKVGLRRGRIDKVFCLLIIIMIVGILQDKLFGYLDKKLFPHKYQSVKAQWEDEEDSLTDVVFDQAMTIVGWAFVAVYFILFWDEVTGLLGHVDLLTYLFRDTIWVFHLLFVALVSFKAYRIIDHRKSSKSSKSYKSSAHD